MASNPRYPNCSHAGTMRTIRQPSSARRAVSGAVMTNLLGLTVPAISDTTSDASVPSVPADGHANALSSRSAVNCNRLSGWRVAVK